MREPIVLEADDGPLYVEVVDTGPERRHRNRGHTAREIAYLLAATCECPKCWMKLWRVPAKLVQCPNCGEKWAPQPS